MPKPLAPNNIFQDSTFMKGMNYAGFQAEVFASPESDAAIDALANINANWIAINIFWYQRDQFATHIEANPQKTVSDSSLIHLIQYAKSKGFKILLKPMVDALDETWRGNFSPTSWEAWFDNYEPFILKYAQLAADHNLDLFCVGCEFPMTDEALQNHWISIISKVRTVYSGDLTYAANFNKHSSYKLVQFWDQLDYIGIDAYFSVAKRKGSSVRKMRRRWRRCRKRIEKWHRKHAQGLPIVFTELGVTSMHGGAMKPWEYTAQGQANWNEQANYYESFFHAFQKREWFKGAFWWWWDNPSTGDYIHDTQSNHLLSYSPKGKDAQAVLQAYYS